MDAFGVALRNATILNGASVSETKDLSTGVTLVGFIAPAAWTAAALNIEVSPDGTNWATAGTFDSQGLAVSSWGALTAGAAYVVDAVSMLPWRYVRFRSGTAGAPTNQGADRAFILLTRPLV